jgi:hypothetical protein
MRAFATTRLQDAGLLRREFAHPTNVELALQSGRDEFAAIVGELLYQRLHPATLFCDLRLDGDNLHGRKAQVLDNS